MKTEHFIEKSTNVHGEDVFDYSLTTYVNSHTKVTICCVRHQRTFTQTPDNHLQGHNGCPTCGAERKRSIHAAGGDKFIAAANSIHDNKYDYSRVVYVNNKTKVHIVCRVHGAFDQTPVNHTYLKQGCPTCHAQSRGVSRRTTLAHFIDRSNNVHRNTYDYSQATYVNNHTPIVILCKKHGAFSQRPSDHLHLRAGCPKCASSKGEAAVRQVLEKQSLQFEEQKTFPECVSALGRKLKFDFFIPTLDLLIEYDGLHHYQQITGRENLSNIQERDNIKTEFALRSGIKLLRIPYTADIHELLTSYLSNLESCDSDPRKIDQDASPQNLAEPTSL